MLLLPSWQNESIRNSSVHSRFAEIFQRLMGVCPDDTWNFPRAKELANEQNEIRL
jgi:hypothetical protein